MKLASSLVLKAGLRRGSSEIDLLFIGRIEMTPSSFTVGQGSSNKASNLPPS